MALVVVHATVGIDWIGVDYAKKAVSIEMA